MGVLNTHISHGNLDVHIRHGGGGFRSPMVYVLIALVIFVVLGASAAAISAALMTLVIWVGAAIGAGLILGSLAWFLTRGVRAQRVQAFNDYRIERDEAHHRRRLEMVREKARIRAQENGAMAIMIAEAIKAGQQPTWHPPVPYVPPTVRAEVLKPEDEN